MVTPPAPPAWRAGIEPQYPGWYGYRGLLDQLGGDAFPGTAELNGLLPAGLVTDGGSPLRFVPASCVPGVDYERHIILTGQVPTREDNWHDLFNALVWCRWPHLKRAMNTQHERYRSGGSGGSRGAVRDALTLFDECGAVVFSSDSKLLRAIAGHQWQTVFEAEPAPRVLVTGHALLEKFLRPYKSMTAHALLVAADAGADYSSPGALIGALDRRLASMVRAGRLLHSPPVLSPLPLCGLKDWWSGLQDREFYADSRVFRPLSPAREAAPIIRL